MELNSKNKIVLVSDYGRSGQGWLSYMLCYILNATFIEPYDFLQGKKYSSSEHILSLTRGNLVNRDKTDYSLIVKTHNYPTQNLNLTDKIIFLTRDPRDVAVSAYFLHLSNLKFLSRKNFKQKLYIILITKLRFIDYFLTISKWKKHYLAWQSVEKFNVKYEDLLLDTEKTLKNILNYLEIFQQESIINESVEIFSFEKMSGRKKGEEDREKPEFRKGIAGDYKNYFSKLENFLTKLICKNEAKKAGYDI